MALGERIRKLRKEQNMTLAELAGDEITKGMLSLIENEKSKPSMATLEYIAGKLNVSIGYLTREGDEAWTKEMVESDVLYNTYTFPSEFIEENILPNLDKIAASQTGMSLYHIVRVYYRYIGQHKLADQVTEKVVSFYEQMGLKNSALKDKINDALSMLYSRDYEKGYGKFLSLEEEIQKFKEYDSGLELDYLYWRSVFALEFDEDDFIDFGNALIERSFKLENFKYYFMQNSLFGYYYGTIGDDDKYEEYTENIKRYLNFNPDSYYDLAIFNEKHPVQISYILLEDQEEHLNDLKKYKEKIISGEIDDPRYNKNYLNIVDTLDLEINFHSGDFEYVVNNFKYTLYDRPIAQFPLDRILNMTRATVYPMSLFKTGRIEEARTEFEKLETSISDLKDSIFTKEFNMVKHIIFDGK